jgi:ribonuclease BN (tRNA processing enzyme)
MFVKCLGSGDAFGSGGKLNTSFYIRTNTSSLLVDCGVTTLLALKKERLSAGDLDLIIISHLHGDHFGGLPFILCEVIAGWKRNKLLTIIGPEGTQQKTLQVLEAFFPGMKLAPEHNIKFETFTTEKMIESNGVQITPYPAVHSPSTKPHSLRIVADGKVVAYSGDTEWSDTLLRVSMNADLFICEASTWKSEVKYHLSVKDILAQLHRIQVKRIVLTHLGEEALKHRDAIPLTIAEDGMVLLNE